jgi:hypothetical protein
LVVQKRPARNATGRPTASPRPTGANAPGNTTNNTLPRSAPRAIRTPISRSASLLDTQSYRITLPKPVSTPTAQTVWSNGQSTFLIEVAAHLIVEGMQVNDRSVLIDVLQRMAHHSSRSWGGLMKRNSKLFPRRQKRQCRLRRLAAPVANRGFDSPYPKQI